MARSGGALRAPGTVRAAGAVFASALATMLGCGGPSVPNPFVDSGVDSGRGDGGVEAAQGDAATSFDATGDVGQGLGGPCLDDEQCDDGVDCTADSCDPTLQRCRFVADHSVCQDGVFCNGEEVCSGRLGCRPGDPVACSDEDTCTLDVCVEADRACAHRPRDVDGDGDPDWNCAQGGDCNELDPTVSSLAPELCANGRDDDCDGEIDEGECESPQHDTCIDPLEIAAPGTYSLETAAARSDYSATCAGSGGAWRDVVAALIIPDGPPVDVDLVARGGSGALAVAGATQCGDASSEIGCAGGFPHPSGGQLARLRLRGLTPGNYPVYAFTSGAQPVTLTVDFLDPSAVSTNETCGTAQPVVFGQHVEVEIVGAADDIPTACSVPTGELVYRFDLTAVQDVEVFAASVDGYGMPSVSLLSDPCTDGGAEITCQTAQGVALFARALVPGSYFVAVSGTGPTDVDLVVESLPPTVAPADDDCDQAPSLERNRELLLLLDGHVDAARLGCLPGARDAAYELAIAERSDVLLLERISSDDTGAVSLATPPCASSQDAIACGKSDRSPVRAAAHDLPPGDYRAVVESAQASPVTLAAFVRPAASPLFVAFAETCEEAVDVPPGGGLLRGNTANVSADYDLTCDLGGQSAGGGPDQVLRLVLDAKKRVVLDMKGSSYQTLLEVRRGPGCPGAPIAQGCAAGYVVDRSFLDLTLDAGEYFVFVDGYNADAGAWQLDVFVADP